ncbi:MAG: hypothetical protein D3904_16890 [Candidatus Electrothrix sp. EH2]|nr:hypothetical protein [Candidatus Electrothrix sp. EH2]
MEAAIKFLSPGRYGRNDNISFLFLFDLLRKFYRILFFLGRNTVRLKERRKGARKDRSRSGLHNG